MFQMWISTWNIRAIEKDSTTYMHLWLLSVRVTLPWIGPAKSMRYHLERIAAYCWLTPNMEKYGGLWLFKSRSPWSFPEVPQDHRKKPLGMRGRSLTLQAVRMFHQGITRATRCTRTWHHHMGVHILRKLVQVQRRATKIIKKLQGAMGMHGATTEYSWLSCQVDQSDHWLWRDHIFPYWTERKKALYVLVLGLFQDYVDMMYTRHLSNRIYHPRLLAAPLALIIPKIHPSLFQSMKHMIASW